MHHVECTTEEKKRELRKKVEEYLARAEKLKERVKEQDGKQCMAHTPLVGLSYIVVIAQCLQREFSAFRLEQERQDTAMVPYSASVWMEMWRLLQSVTHTSGQDISSIILSGSVNWQLEAVES